MLGFIQSSGSSEFNDINIKFQRKVWLTDLQAQNDATIPLLFHQVSVRFLINHNSKYLILGGRPIFVW
jgi:hypothetical protein